jgi:hypothetical protein
MPGYRDFRCGSGNHLREPPCKTIPGTLGHIRAWFSQFRCVNRPGKLGVILISFRLTSEGFVGSNPTAPTIFEYLIRRVIRRAEESEKYLA